jgi:hypothetical protein
MHENMSQPLQHLFAGDERSPSPHTLVDIA